MTEKQRRFVEAYVGEAKGNATEAARVAGYKCPEVSAKKNIPNYTIQEAIKAKLQTAIDNGQIPDATETLTLLGDHLRASLADFIEPIAGTDRYMVRLDKADAAGKLHLLKEVEMTRQGGIKIKMVDTQKALELAMKYHGLLLDRLANADGSNIEPVTIVEVIRSSE